MIPARVLVIAGVVLAAAASCTTDDPIGGASPAPSTDDPAASAAAPVSPRTDAPSGQPPDERARPSQRSATPAIGIAVPAGRSSTVASIERSAGANFDLVRLFARWDTPFPSPDDASHLAAGRRIHLSIRPVTQQGRVIPWAELARAEPGEPVYGQLQAWVDRIVDLGPGARVTINHEPETRDSAANGSAADFVAMWRRFVELLRAGGGEDIETVWVMTSGSFGDDRAEIWYPGDDVVDVIGADLYNWYTCQGTDRPWVPFADLIEPPRDFARARGKPLAVPEFASVEDSEQPGRKAQWIIDATAWLSDPAVVDDIAFVAWFDVTAPAGTWPDCVWDHDSSEEAADAFGSMVSALSGR